MRAGNVYAVIMAGGVGERFWPLSRAGNPKQFLDVFTGKPLLLTTAERTAGFIPPQNLIVVTGRRYQAKTLGLFRGWKGLTIIGEPLGRNTAPAVAAAAALAERRDPNAVLVNFPADHVIRPRAAFLNSLRLAVRHAEEGFLVCLGVKPRFAHTGLGYIEMGKKLSAHCGATGHAVKRFVEKPALAKAKKFVTSGQFLWNCGIFTWSCRSLLSALAQYMPGLYALLEPVRRAPSQAVALRALDRFYRQVEPESIDYGVLEKAANVAVVEAPINWDDVGSWEAFRNLFPKGAQGNLFRGPSVDLESKNTLVHSDGGLTATFGLSNVVLIRQGDCVLAISRERAADLKRLVAEIRKRGYHKYL